MAHPNSNRPEGAMFSSSQPSQASASPQSSMLAAEPAWASAIDDVAFGCECANPALQIPMWGQEAGEAIPTAAASC
jgi:hypothetical protein